MKDRKLNADSPFDHRRAHEIEIQYLVLRAVAAFNSIS